MQRYVVIRYDARCRETIMDNSTLSAALDNERRRNRSGQDSLVCSVNSLLSKAEEAQD